MYYKVLCEKIYSALPKLDSPNFQNLGVMGISNKFYDEL